MRKSQPLMLFAFLAAVFFACSKDSQEKLSLAGAMADADTTGFEGPMLCYHDYSNTLNDPPSDYIPGQAQIDLNTCLSAYNGSSGNAGNPRKLLPPAPKVILVREPFPPEPGSEPDDNLRYIAFFGLSPVHSDEAAFAAASVTFEHYSNIVCDAIAENITFADPSYADKAMAGVIYANNHPEIFTSVADKDQFLAFLSMVFQKPAFTISIGRRAIRTDINAFSPSLSCVNLALVLLF